MSPWASGARPSPRRQQDDDQDAFGAAQYTKARAVREHYQARLAKIRKAIIDKNVVIPDGSIIGYDLDADRAMGFTITDSGIVVVPKKER